MKQETRYTIAFLAAKLANPNNSAMTIYSSTDGSKTFSGTVTPSEINLYESGAGSVRASGSGNYFSKVQASNTSEEFELQAETTKFEAKVNGETIQGYLSGNSVTFNSGESYELK